MSMRFADKEAFFPDGQEDVVKKLTPRTLPPPDPFVFEPPPPPPPQTDFKKQARASIPKKQFAKRKKGK